MRMALSTGFPPIVNSGANVLVVGSLPSRKSIETSEYYAHPQNAFWRIMGELFGAGCNVPYAERIDILKANNIAIWDVLSESVRPGSMDAHIDLSKSKPNDFMSFLKTYSNIRLMCFNGQKAATMFRDMVLSQHCELYSGLRFETLPSTSAAFASMPFEEKLRKWTIVLKGVGSRQCKVIKSECSNSPKRRIT